MKEANEASGLEEDMERISIVYVVYVCVLNRYKCSNCVVIYMSYMS